MRHIAYLWSKHQFHNDWKWRQILKLAHTIQMLKSHLIKYIRYLHILVLIYWYLITDSNCLIHSATQQIAPRPRSARILISGGGNLVTVDEGLFRLCPARLPLQKLKSRRMPPSLRIQERILFKLLPNTLTLYKT